MSCRSVKASCIANLPPCFLGTEVPGGDRPGPIFQTSFLSWRTPQPNVRTFHSMAQGWVPTFHRNLHPAHFAPLCWEEGLWPIESQTLDHPSYQQWGDRTPWKDVGHYTATVKQWFSIPMVLHFCLGPLAVQTLLVVVAIVSKKRSFDHAHKMQDTSWHWMFLFSFCFVFLYLCLCILMRDALLIWSDMHRLHLMSKFSSHSLVHCATVTL